MSLGTYIYIYYHHEKTEGSLTDFSELSSHLWTRINSQSLWMFYKHKMSLQ